MNRFSEFEIKMLCKLPILDPLRFKDVNLVHKLNINDCFISQVWLTIYLDIAKFDLPCEVAQR